jgi:plastocyanin
LGLTIAACLPAEDIRGTIVVKRRLSKPRVSAAVPLYQRGPGAAPDAKAIEDPLAMERERVAVYIDAAPSSPSMPAGTIPVVTMDQKSRRFVPETVVVAAGGLVSFPNLDPIFHNVFSLSKTKSFDLGNYPKGSTRTVTFKTPGIVYVGCHLHADMSGTIVVTPNAWNARVDAEGGFALHDVPPGDYTVVAWHRTAGYFRERVSVKAGRDANISFLIPLPAEDVREEFRPVEAHGAASGALAIMR